MRTQPEVLLTEGCVMDVRTGCPCHNPFSLDFEGLTEIFAQMFAGMSSPKLPLWADFLFLKHDTFPQQHQWAWPWQQRRRKNKPTRWQEWQEDTSTGRSLFEPWAKQTSRMRRLFASNCAGEKKTPLGRCGLPNQCRNRAETNLICACLKKITQFLVAFDWLLFCVSFSWPSFRLAVGFSWLLYIYIYMCTSHLPLKSSGSYFSPQVWKFARGFKILHTEIWGCSKYKDLLYTPPSFVHNTPKLTTAEIFCFIFHCLCVSVYFLSPETSRCTPRLCLNCDFPQRCMEKRQDLDIFETTVTVTPPTGNFKNFKFFKASLKILNVYFEGKNVKL